MTCASQKFWLENLGGLFSSIQLVPLNNMNLAQQLNSITRLVILIFIIMLLFNFEYSVHFLIISLVFVIIIYYIQRKKMETYKPTKSHSSSVEYYTSTSGLPYSGPSPRVSAVNTQPTNLNSLAQNVTLNTNKGKVLSTTFSTGEALTFCNDGVYIDPPTMAATTLNQNLVGGANPRTKIKPVVIAPSHDISFWRADNFIIPTSTNKDRVNEDMYLSGYAESTCCGYLPSGSTLDPVDENIQPVAIGGRVPEPSPKTRYATDADKQVKENYKETWNYSPPINCSIPQGQSVYRSPPNVGGYGKGGRGIVAPTPAVDIPYAPSIPVEDYKETWNYSPPINCSIPQGQSVYRSPPNVGGYGKGGRGIVAPTPAVDIPYAPSIPVAQSVGQSVGRNVENFEHRRENYNYYGTAKTIEDPSWAIVQENQPGWINTTCGYDPYQALNAGLPSNLPVGNCEKDPRMKVYNENIFTSIVTPGVYTRTQVNEPINSNIGISFQQQFEPTSCRRDDRGLHYLQHDPRIIEPAEINDITEIVDDKADYGNVYDPRFYGYGTSYRSYLEPVTGQTRFMYDDVNAIKMPNYVTRSKIDFLPYADQYGPIQAGSEFGNEKTPYIRTLAQDSWMRDSLQFRNDLTERRMRKINAEAWQKRVAPMGPAPVGSYKR